MLFRSGAASGGVEPRRGDGQQVPWAALGWSSLEYQRRGGSRSSRTADRRVAWRSSGFVRRAARLAAIGSMRLAGFGPPRLDGMASPLADAAVHPLADSDGQHGLTLVFHLVRRDAGGVMG